LEEETGYTKGELWIVDLRDFASVKHFGERFEKDEGRLDILVANAAVSTGKYEATKNGWESTSVLFSVDISVNDLSGIFAGYKLIVSQQTFHAPNGKTSLVNSAHCCRNKRSALLGRDR
jgi:NAD(P)-dependent dehydrogenase (short-subunit alcohol dehydrogenase family)